MNVAAAIQAVRGGDLSKVTVIRQFVTRKGWRALETMHGLSKSTVREWERSHVEATAPALIAARLTEMSEVIRQTGLTEEEVQRVLDGWHSGTEPSDTERVEFDRVTQKLGMENFLFLTRHQPR